MDTLAGLQDKINRAAAAYHTTGESGIPDEVYDAWVQELMEQDPTADLLGDDVVGSAPGESSPLAKAAHQGFMGSLFNAMDEAEFRAFDQRVGGGPYLCQPKIDGASLRLYYVKGELVQAITRGDGLVGEDVTANVRKFKNLPQQLRQPFNGSVRGEAVLSIDDWLLVDPDQESNPRNLGTGILRRLDGMESNLISFFAFDMDGVFETEWQKTEAMQEAGFEVPPSFLQAGADEVVKSHALYNAERGSLPYWIDGYVVKVNDIDHQTVLGISGKRPRGQIAFKFKAQTATTTLRGVELTVGHTGAIIPTGKFDPVRLGGTTVASALLCNWQVIADLDIAIGDEVVIYKAGEIIPKVLKVLNRPADRQAIEEPSACPVCGGDARRRVKSKGEVGVITECTHPECEAKFIGKIGRWVRSLNILGLGDELLGALTTTTVQELTDDYGLADCPLVISVPDLYRLNQFPIDKLGHLQVNGRKFGKSRMTAVLAEIDKTRRLSIDEFLGSLGVPHMGKRKVELMRAAEPRLNAFRAWFDGTLLEVRESAGVPNVGETIAAGLRRVEPIVQELIDLGIEVYIPQPKEEVPAQGPLAGRGFILTGKFDQPKKVIEAAIVAAGGSIEGSVKAGVTLVQSDPSSSSSKSEKARKLGCEILGVDEVYALIGAS